MKVPTDEEGRPRFSISSFRTYGAGEIPIPGQERSKGCPLQFWHKYDQKDLPPETRSEDLEFGSILHRALEIMESEDVGPEEALERAWSPFMPEKMWSDVLAVLNKYIERGGPITRMATIASELDVSALLYEDEDFGPVMFRSILDYVGLDPDDHGLLHIVDFKSNRVRPTLEQVRSDLQMKSQDWIVRQLWDRWLPGRPPRTVVHMDALRHGDVAVRFTPDEIAEFHGWAIAIARKILRDEDHKPVLNDGCTWCPVKHTCPEFSKLPGVARSIALRRTGQTPEELWRHLNLLKRAKKLVDGQVKEINALLEREAQLRGGLEFSGQVWKAETNWETEADMLRLHELLGTAFYDAVSVSKTSVERATAHLPAAVRAQALACLRRVPSGQKIGKQSK